MLDRIVLDFVSNPKNNSDLFRLENVLHLQMFISFVERNVLFQKLAEHFLSDILVVYENGEC